RSARSSSGSSARIMASIAMTIRAVSKSVMVRKCRKNPVSDQLLNNSSSHWGNISSASISSRIVGGSSRWGPSSNWSSSGRHDSSKS
ncbi:hypothetical protein Tco_1152439, partial [Tanacetum coccineum]